MKKIVDIELPVTLDTLLEDLLTPDSLAYMENPVCEIYVSNKRMKELEKMRDEKDS